LHRWNSSASFGGVTTHPAYLERPADMTTSGEGEVALIDLVLEGGQTIRVHQNGGFTNAQFKIDFRVQELPA